MIKKNIIISGIILMLLMYAPVLFLSKDVLVILTKEDGAYESLTALLFFFASIVFLFIFLKAKRRNVFLLLFTIAFFFSAGEEISWGQRIFGFETPTYFEANNAQKEFNIHNLSFVQHENGIGSSIKGLLFNFNRLFILASTIYSFLIPLAARYSSILKSIFSKIKLPILSLWFGILFLVNEVTSKLLELFVVACQTNIICPEVAEIKEALWALFVFLWAIYFLIEYVPNKNKVFLSPSSL